MGTLTKEVTLPFSVLKSTHHRICSNGSKFFLSRIDPSLERLFRPGKETGSHKKLFPLVIMVVKHGRVQHTSSSKPN